MINHLDMRMTLTDVKSVTAALQLAGKGAVRERMLQVSRSKLQEKDLSLIVTSYPKLPHRYVLHTEIST